MYTGFYTPPPQKPRHNRFYIAIIFGMLIVSFLGGTAFYLGERYVNENPLNGEYDPFEFFTKTSPTPPVTMRPVLPEGEKPDLKISDIPQSQPALSDGALTASEVYEKVAPCVVAILALDPDKETLGTGTGAVISSDGYILTNHHVVYDSYYINVVFPDGGEYDAIIVGMDYLTDLAVIKISATELPFVELGNSSQLRPGDKAYAIGNPLGLELQNTITDGIISAINRDIELSRSVKMTLLQTNCAVNPGNSGGPLCNEYGQVVGIISSKIMGDYSTTMEGLGFAIPVSSAMPVLQSIIERGYVLNRPAIGVTADTSVQISERNKSRYGVSFGVLVDSVNEKSDAYQKGIRPDDIITHVNGEEVTDIYEINEIKSNFNVGDYLTITIYSDGKTKDIEILLMEQGELD